MVSFSLQISPGAAVLLYLIAFSIFVFCFFKFILS